MPLNVVSEQSLYCLPILQQFIITIKFIFSGPLWLLNPSILGFLKIYMWVTDEALLADTKLVWPRNLDTPAALSFVNVFIALKGISF